MACLAHSRRWRDRHDHVGLLLPWGCSAGGVVGELVEVVVECWLRRNVHIHVHVNGELVDIGEGVLVGVVGVG